MARARHQGGTTHVRVLGVGQACVCVCTRRVCPCPGLMQGRLPSLSIQPKLRTLGSCSTRSSLRSTSRRLSSNGSAAHGIVEYREDQAFSSVSLETNTTSNGARTRRYTCWARAWAVACRTRTHRAPAHTHRRTRTHTHTRARTHTRRQIHSRHFHSEKGIGVCVCACRRSPMLSHACALMLRT
jgi:hypothetical protein